MVDKLTYKIDGLKAEFDKPDQIELVQHLNELLDMWKTTARTYMQAIDMLYEGKKCSGK